MSSLSSLTDEEVVVQVREEGEQYREIIHRYQKRLLRYATFLLNDSNLAEDAVQQGFIKAYVNLQSFNLKKKFSSWLYRIVHNEAMNLVKHQHPTQSLIAKLDYPSSANLEDAYVRQELRHLTRSCLAAIPLSYREPISLYYLEDKSYQEISDILHLPVSTVGVRLNRGKQYLRSICAKKI